jgi:hypothetical protein
VYLPTLCQITIRPAGGGVDWAALDRLTKRAERPVKFLLLSMLATWVSGACSTVCMHACRVWECTQGYAHSASAADGTFRNLLSGGRGDYSSSRQPVLEAHVASLAPGLGHLIMIGDHTAAAQD